MAALTPAVTGPVVVGAGLLGQLRVMAEYDAWATYKLMSALISGWFDTSLHTGTSHNHDRLTSRAGMPACRGDGGAIPLARQTLLPFNPWRFFTRCPWDKIVAFPDHGVPFRGNRALLGVRVCWSGGLIECLGISLPDSRNVVQRVSQALGRLCKATGGAFRGEAQRPVCVSGYGGKRADRPPRVHVVPRVQSRHSPSRPNHVRGAQAREGEG